MNVLGYGRNMGQHSIRSANGEVIAVMLTEVETMQAHLVGKIRLLHDVLKSGDVITIRDIAASVNTELKIFRI